ncbi:MAG: mechanosensitive ion channel family protein, partial [Saprospiraceae bacterium]
AKLSLHKEQGVNIEKQSILLKQILDGKGLYVILSKIPKEADFQNDNKKSTYVLFPNELPEVYVQKYGDKWLYSEETVEMLPILHKNMYPYGSSYLLKVLPAAGTGKFLGIQVWQYLGIAVYLILGFIFFNILTLISDLIIKGIFNSRLKNSVPDKKLIHSISKLISYIAIISLIILFLPVLQLPIKFSRFLFIALDILRYSFAIVLALRVLDFIMVFVGKAVSETETKMDDQLQVIIRRAIQIAIVIFGFIAILSRLDINVTALLAGVSIGGLAIALAAQDTVKNLLGAAMIFVDKPFDIGDYVITGSVTGVIHEVGFRSTKLMASDTSIISVPNGKLADEVINNLGKRVYRRYRTSVGITYSTSPNLINKFTEGIKKIFNANDKILSEKTSIYLNEFSAS